jgi:hypothetical protein
MKPLIQDRGYDNATLGQGYRTPRAAVICGRWNDDWQGNTEELGDKSAAVHFVHHESHFKSPRIERGFQQ